MQTPKALRGNRYRDLSDAALTYIMRDAGDAAQKMRGFDPVAEGKYLDQVSDAATVKYHRQQRGIK